jgi:hypothetical protein
VPRGAGHREWRRDCRRLEGGIDAAPLNGKRLLALWNALPSAEKRRKVGDREALMDELWLAIEALPDPEPQSDAKRPSKQDEVIAILRRPEGATVDEVSSATGWQRHTVRGVFSGTLKKKLGLTIASAKEERGRVYRIAEPASLWNLQSMTPQLASALVGRRPFAVGAATGTTELEDSTWPRLKLKLPNWPSGQRTICGWVGAGCMGLTHL